ncbi:hypothetical protein H4582DRAFT_2109528 [Lactarius indigo]|nr:hypothetical protein H4582DRAFT_2109528 [Lactarius indigo]
MSFFRSIMRARPIGLHRHFHVLSMRTAIHQDTGRYVSIDDIWEKLRSCYNVDALESLDAEGFESPGSAHSTPSVVDSPSPSDNLSLHPYFRKEFALPYDEALDTIISNRRMRDSASSTSLSPSPPPPPVKGRRGRRRGRGAGSDSSALTLESGDESVVAPTPKGSVNTTGTDGATEYGDDEDVEVAASPEVVGEAGGAEGRAGGGEGPKSTRGTKKRKRGA